MCSENRLQRQVLVVEDELDFAALMKSLLERGGYIVNVAGDGETAFDCVCEDRPDLITLDIHMPRQSGALFYRKLKADERFRGIPVVVVTGLTHGDKDMENTLKVFLEPDHAPPPENYVEKTVVQERLLGAIEQILEC